MKFITTILLIAAFSFAAFAQKPDSSKPAEAKPTPSPKLPSATEIVEKYVKAIGGRDAFKKRTSSHQTAAVELSPMGVKGTVETFQRSDDRLLVKMNLAGIGEILTGYDGTNGWTVNPIQGNRVLAGKELLQMKRTAMFSRELAFDKLYKTLNVRGAENVGDRKTYVVVGASEGLPDDVYYFDAETGLLLRTDTVTVAAEGEQSVTTIYEDYREVEGTKMPFKSRAKTPAFEIISSVTDVKFNIPIEDAKFTQPK